MSPTFALEKVLVCCGDGKTEETDVVVKDGVVTAVSPGAAAEHLAGLSAVDRARVEVIHCDGDRMLLPGMVNGHTHSSEMWQRGAIRPFPLELWLCELIDHAVDDPEMVYLSSMHCGIETLLSGGTCIMDHLSMIQDQPLETIRMAVKAYTDLGMRAFVAPLIGDIDIMRSIPMEKGAGPGKACKLPPRDRLLTEKWLASLRTAAEEIHGSEAAERAPKDPRGNLLVQLGVGPTGVQLCSDELYVGCKEISEKYDLVRHTHLLETKAQQQLSFEKYGKSAAEHLQDIGFLDAKTTCAHSIWLNDDDIAALQRNGSTAVHNALSNIRLGSGIAPVLKYRREGVNVCFGCDGAASNDGQDLLEAVKIGSMLHNTTDPDYRNWLTPQQSLDMATAGGYRGVGLQEVAGKIAIGMVADMVLYDLTSLSMLPRTDPLGLLLWGRPSGALDSVWVAGRRLVRGGEVVTVDMREFKRRLRDKATAYSAQPRPSELVDALEPHYRKVML
mmetsp:Transcript_777/g.2815  ORF Transcript_777/g.2815 Transcript_777/m.2815 type:complete len:501 (+) Transcript_777:57-1559(+)